MRKWTEQKENKKKKGKKRGGGKEEREYRLIYIYFLGGNGN